MTDLSLTIAPKSDQLNADDLIPGPLTIRVTRVSACPDSAEQPIAINFEGDHGKPYKPCKSMRRVLVQVWGKDGATYPGRSMTLYRDPDVQFGGLKVGGIRISHMSGIDKPVTMALTATRANRKPYTVKPLVVEQPKPAAPWEGMKWPVCSRDGKCQDAGDADAWQAEMQNRVKLIQTRDSIPADMKPALIRAVLDANRAPMEMLRERGFGGVVEDVEALFGAALGAAPADQDAAA